MSDMFEDYNPKTPVTASWLNRVNNFITGVVTDAGSDLIGFVQSGIGAVRRTLQDKNRDQLNIKDYGVPCNTGTDATAAWQALIAKVGAVAAFEGTTAAIEMYLPWRAKVKLEGTLLLPSFIKINLNGGVLEGIGTNVGIESGYFNGSGNLVSNHGQANETQFVIGSSVYNGNMLNFNRAFKLFNFCEDSEITKIRMVGCNQAVYAKRCFYGLFTKLHTRSPLDRNALPAFHFDGAVNAITITSNFPVNYLKGWQFSGTKDGVYASTCGAESCDTGVTVSDSTSGIHFHHWYFENCYNAIDCDGTGNHENVVVTSSFFNSVVNALQGVTIVSGEFAASNKLSGAAAVSLATNFSNRVTVRIPPSMDADNVVPAVPSAYQLGDANLVDYVKMIYNSVSGFVSFKGRVHGGIIPLHYSGDTGLPIANVIPFCVSSLSATELVVDTKLNYRDGACLFVQLLIQATGIQQVLGLYGGGVEMILVKPVGIAVAVSNNAGFYRFSITGLVGATAHSGIIRHLA